MTPRPVLEALRVLRYPPGEPLDHDVAGVTVAEPEDVAGDARNGQAARKRDALREPRFGAGRPQPEHLGEVVALRLRQRVLEHFHLDTEQKHRE